LNGWNLEFKQYKLPFFEDSKEQNQITFSVDLTGMQYLFEGLDLEPFFVVMSLKGEFKHFVFLFVF
jgi:hypothetical protein